MKKRVSILIVLLFSLGLSAGLTKAPTVHDFFVSITQIDHNAENKTLEITFKIFVDDFEKVIKEEGLSHLNLGTESENEKTDIYIQRYLENYFVIQVNQGEVMTAMTWDYLGKEVEEDVLWLYVEVLEVAEVKQLKVQNEILMSTFPTQTNIVHVKVNGKEKSMLLNTGNRMEELVFD